MRLTTSGVPVGLTQAVVGRVCVGPTEENSRPEQIFVGAVDELSSFRDLIGYRAVITPSRLADAHELQCPVIHSVREYDHLNSGDLVVMQPGTGFVRTLYRPESKQNALFMTERCNSNCLMCSQPPKDHDDTEHFVRTNLELIRLISPSPEYLEITGGEPTLLGDGVLRIIASLRDNLPNTHVHMLTNGRRFAWRNFAGQFAAVGHHDLTLGIPLYSDDRVTHDYVVQAREAFNQTMMGLHTLARWRQKIEIRVVLHKITIPRLVPLAHFIYRNLPFVSHVALMGLEPTGYTPRNRKQLWIDPVEYQEELEAAVEVLSVRGMNVSLYNLQLCLLRPSLWKFTRKSISDWKNIYLPECESCGKLLDCGGLFQSAEKMHSPRIHPLRGITVIGSDLPA